MGALSATTLLAAGCAGEQSDVEGGAPGAGGKADDTTVQPLQRGTPEHPAVPRAVVGATVDGTILTLELRFGGGCEEHGFELFWDGTVTSDDPAGVPLVLTDKGANDPCEMVLSATVAFDISEVRDALGDASVFDLQFGDESLRACDGGCPGVGESCDNAIVLAAGDNAVSWEASALDYVKQGKATCRRQSREVDVVLEYTAQADGILEIDLQSDSDSYIATISDEPCGQIDDPLFCRGASESGHYGRAGAFAATAGTTYYLYVASIHGVALPEVLDVSVRERVTTCDPSGLGLDLSMHSVELSGNSESSSFTVTSADDDPDGWVYMSDGSDFHYRVGKKTGELQPIIGRGDESAAPLPVEGSLGGNRRVVAVGDEVYMIETDLDFDTNTTTHRQYLLSEDRGTHWASSLGEALCREDVLPGRPGSDLDRVFDGDDFIVPLGLNEFWLLPKCGVDREPERVASLDPASHCTGLTLDDDALYTKCMAEGFSSPYSMIRIDRETGAAATVAPAYDRGSLHAVDSDGDGQADALISASETGDNPSRLAYACLSSTEEELTVGFPGADRMFINFDRRVQYEPTEGQVFWYDEDQNALVVLQ